MRYIITKPQFNLLQTEFFLEKKNLDNCYFGINESKKDQYKLSKKKLEYFINSGKKHMGYSEEESKEEVESIISSIRNLPEEIKLFRIIRVDDKKNIDIKKLGDHYAKNKKDLLDSHSFAEGIGDNSYMITVIAPKTLVDFEETIHNNLLYPNENEVTLKNKGEGVKIVSIRKILNKKEVNEKWSEKYKKSINCNNPKGFSQRAHCQGRKKRLKESDENTGTRNKKLILSMFNKGLNYKQIKQITNLDNELIADTIKYRMKIHEFGCNELHEIFYDLLWETKLIKKNHVFEDGSVIELSEDYFTETIDFHYYDNFYIKGLATFLYDGECQIPIDVTEAGYVGGDYLDFDSYKWVNLKKFIDFNEMETLDDLINYFNVTYFMLLKSYLDSISDALKQNFD